MAHVYRTPKGWRYQAEIAPDPVTGARRQRRFGPFPTKREAERSAADLAAELRGGAEFSGARLTLAEFFLEEWLPAQKRLKATTFDGYDFQARTYLIPRLGHILLRDLTTRTIVKFINAFAADITRFGTQRKPRSVRAAHRVLHMALEDARRWGHIARNPASDARSALPPIDRDSGKVDWWSIEQLRYWLELVRDHRLYALWLLLCTTGMRRSEVAGIRWPDIDWEAGSVAVVRGRVNTRSGPHTEDTPKGGSSRTVPLDPLVMQALAAHRERQAEERALLGSRWHGEDYVFTGEKGGPIRPDYIWTAFQNTRADLPRIPLHGLRTSYVTAARVAEVPSEAVADVVGHSTDRTTKDVYQRVDPRVVANATTKINRLLLGDGDTDHAEVFRDSGPALLEPLSSTELEAVTKVLDIVSTAETSTRGEPERTSSSRTLMDLVRQALMSATEQVTPRSALVPLLDAVLRSDAVSTGLLTKDDWLVVQDALRSVGWHTTAAGLGAWQRRDNR